MVRYKVRQSYEKFSVQGEMCGKFRARGRVPHLALYSESTGSNPVVPAMRNFAQKINY